MADKKKIDYTLMEADWLAGIKPVRTIADEYEKATGTKVSHVSITKHFERRGLDRDLKGKIRAKAESLVNKAEVNKTANENARVNQDEIIAVAARNQADTILAHRKDIPRYQKLASSLMEELESQTGNKELFDQLADLLQAPDEKGLDKLNEIYRKVIGSPQRIDSFKKLTETYKVLIGLERQAFGISDNANGEADKPNIPTSNLTPEEAYKRLINGS